MRFIIYIFKIIFILPLLCGNSIAQDPTFMQWQPQIQEVTSVATPTPPPTAVQKPTTYEDFLGGIEELVKSILPERKKLDSLKAAANAETPAAKDEFEKQADYEKRVTDFKTEKQQKILAFEQEYQSKTKESVDKINKDITDNEDFQPNWDGMLKKDTDAEGYKERINKFNNKIPIMKDKISQISELLGKIYLDKKDIETMQDSWQQKNMLYLSRLKQAGELMQDYIMQEQTKILTSEKKKMEMNLGNYNAETEDFEFSINDSSSQTIPFDFSGTMKMSPALARETNRQADNFTASVDYINYPFIIHGEKLYPGAKKTRVYYKEQELATNGIFKEINRLNSMDGYLEWTAYADSLLSGKLAPKNLDSSYAMDAKDIKIASNVSSSSGDGFSFWTSKNTVRILAFGLSAASLGLGVWQNNKVKSKVEKMNRLTDEARYAYNNSSDEYPEKYYVYKKKYNDAKSSENLRNGFYIGAGVFGIAGAATFFF